MRSQFAVYLLYILPIGAIALSTSVILYGQRVRPVLARLAAPVIAPLAFLTARLRRA